MHIFRGDGAGATCCLKKKGEKHCACQSTRRKKDYSIVKLSFFFLNATHQTTRGTNNLPLDIIQQLLTGRDYIDRILFRSVFSSPITIFTTYIKSQFALHRFHEKSTAIHPYGRRFIPESTKTAECILRQVGLYQSFPNPPEDPTRSQ